MNIHSTKEIKDGTGFEPNVRWVPLTPAQVGLIEEVAAELDDLDPSVTARYRTGEPVWNRDRAVEALLRKVLRALAVGEVVTEPSVAVIGWGMWGHAADLNTAKLNFRNHGGRLSQAYTIVEFPQGVKFKGVDGMACYHYEWDERWHDVERDERPQPIERIVKGRKTA